MGLLVGQALWLIEVGKKVLMISKGGDRVGGAGEVLTSFGEGMDDCK